jgi:RNA polymerase sigma-70 factor (ECF subfamily)
MTDDAGALASVKSELVALIPRLRRFGYALTGAMDTADDLAQLTLERALMNLHRWTPGTRLDSWLFRIAQNAWIDEMRARKRRGPMLDMEDAPDLVGDDGRSTTQARLDLARVRGYIAELPEPQRAVLALVAVEGLSYQEAAAALDIPIGTVMSRLSRARKAVADRMNARTPAHD